MKRLSFSSHRCGNIKISSANTDRTTLETECWKSQSKQKQNKNKTKTKTKTYAQYVKKSTAPLNKKH